MRTPYRGAESATGRRRKTCGHRTPNFLEADSIREEI